MRRRLAAGYQRFGINGQVNISSLTVNVNSNVNHIRRNLICTFHTWLSTFWLCVQNFVSMVTRAGERWEQCAEEDTWL